MQAERRALLDRLVAPSAITVVGASPNGHITLHLLRNLENRSCAFDGPVHLINPTYSRVFDRRCTPSPADVERSPGLVYLQIRPADCLAALQAFPVLPEGVILFPDASHEPGGYDDQVADWGRENGVAVLGAQSNGLVSLRGRVHGLLVPVVEDFRPGGVAVLAQSGGVLGGIVKCLAQKGVGLHSALEFGTEAMFGSVELAHWLLEEDDVALVAIYTDGIASPRGFADVLLDARARDKAVVLMVGGASEAGERAAASHSGAAAAPRRVIESIARQYGALLVSTLDELIWSIEALDAVGFRRPGGGKVAVFSDSGGGGIAIADALAQAGVDLREPSPSVHADLVTRFGDVLNPFDFGSASMGHVREQRADVLAVAEDEAFGTFAFASNVGLGVREQSVHLRQLDEFLETVEKADRVAVVACPFPYLLDETLHERKALVAFGSTESAIKLRALSRWGGESADARTSSAAPSSHTRSDTIGGNEVRTLLDGLPLVWPVQVVVESSDEVDRLEPQSLPVFVKTEAGLAHRARAGGVLGPLDDWEDVTFAARYLLKRFDGPVSIAASVAGNDDYFVGYYVEDGHPLLLLGAGGDRAEAADVRPLPLSADEIHEFAHRVSIEDGALLERLLDALQDWALDHPWVSAVDLNPVVRTSDGLVVLDAKIHRAAVSAPTLTTAGHE